MIRKSAFQTRSRFRRVENKIRKFFLRAAREANDPGIGNRSPSGVLSGGNHEIADRTAFDFGSAPHKRQPVAGNTRLKTGVSRCCLGHGFILRCEMYGRLPDKSTRGGSKKL